MMGVLFTVCGAHVYLFMYSEFKKISKINWNREYADQHNMMMNVNMIDVYRLKYHLFNSIFILHAWHIQ